MIFHILIYFLVKCFKVQIIFYFSNFSFGKTYYSSDYDIIYKSRSEFVYNKLEFKNEPIKLRFKILLEVYRVSKGYKQTFIAYQHLYQILSCHDSEVNEVHKEIRYLTSEYLLESKALGMVSISHNGIKEVESIVSNSNTNLYFDLDSILDVVIPQEVIDVVYEIRKKRITFLDKVYKQANGDEMVVLQLFTLGQELGYPKEVLERIYFYLEDEGLIQFRFIGGSFSITHKSIRLMDQPIRNDIYEAPSEYSNLYPKPEEMVDDIVELLHQINNLSKTKIGCNIFKADSRTLKDLRLDLIKINRDLRDESTFVLIILKIGTLIDDVYNDEIGKCASKPKNSGSLNLIKQLFIDNNVDTSNLVMLANLRKLHCLRSKKFPVHQDEPGAIAILREFGIEYPVFDWIKVSQVCLLKFIDSLHLMISAIQRI